MNKWINFALTFFVLIILQVMLFNHLQLAYVINPFPYIFVVICFPNTMSNVARTIIGFSLGLIIDMLCATWGIHVIATTFAAFIQPKLLSLIALPEQLDRREPSFLNMKWKFLEYAILMVFIHHFLLFALETFDISLWYWVLIKSCVSTLVTIGVVMLIDRISNARG